MFSLPLSTVSAHSGRKLTTTTLVLSNSSVALNHLVPPPPPPKNIAIAIYIFPPTILIVRKVRKPATTVEQPTPGGKKPLPLRLVLAISKILLDNSVHSCPFSHVGACACPVAPFLFVMNAPPPLSLCFSSPCLAVDRSTKQRYCTAVAFYLPVGVQRHASWAGELGGAPFPERQRCRQVVRPELLSCGGDGVHRVGGVRT